MINDDKLFNLISGTTDEATAVVWEVKNQHKISSDPDLSLDHHLEAYEDIFDSEVGDTSLVRASNIECEVGLWQIYLKFEGANETANYCAWRRS